MATIDDIRISLILRKIGHFHFPSQWSSDFLVVVTNSVKQLRIDIVYYYNLHMHNGKHKWIVGLRAIGHFDRPGVSE